MFPGEVWWGLVQAEHAVGHEQHDGRKEDGSEGGPRAYVVLYGRSFSRQGLVVAAPITTQLQPDRCGQGPHVGIWSTDITPDSRSRTVPKDGVLLLEHMRVMSKERFQERIGKLSPRSWDEVGAQLVAMFQLKPQF